MCLVYWRCDNDEMHFCSALQNRGRGVRCCSLCSIAKEYSSSLSDVMELVGQIVSHEWKEELKNAFALIWVFELEMGW